MNRRGTVLVAIVIALVVLQFAVVAVVLSGSRDHQLRARRVEGARAFYAAEAAMQLAVREAATGSDLDGDGVVGGVASISFGSGSGRVSATDTGSEITLIASSTVGQARRSARAVLRRTGGDGGGRGVGVEVWALKSAPSRLSSVDWNATPAWTGVVPDINFPRRSDSVARFSGMPTSRFAMRFRAQIEIPAAGEWTFHTSSDDGSDLWIDGACVVRNDNQHSMRRRRGSVTLGAGPHELEVRFFENRGDNGLVVYWQGPGVRRRAVVPASAYSTTAVMPPLAAQSTIELRGDDSAYATSVDGYNSSAGAYGGGNIRGSGAVGAINSTVAASWRMSGGAALRGSAVVGPGGSPGSVISLSGASVITGTRTSGASGVAIFAAQPPTIQGRRVSLDLRGSSTRIISGNTRTRAITVSDSAVLTLAGTTIVDVDGDLTVRNAGAIALSPDADITMYVSGAVDLRDDAVVGSSADASRLRICMRGTSRDVSIGGHARLSARVLNPFGRLVVAPSGDAVDSFCGRFAGDGVLASGRAGIHLDLAADGGAGGAASIRVVSWTQVQP